MRAVDLTGDLTFEGLLKNWKENGRPPEVLIDFLLDHGLDYQADNVKWCLEQTEDPMLIGRDLGIRPWKSGETYYSWVKGSHYRSELNSKRFERLFPIGKTLVTFSSYREALLALIDCEPQNEVSLSSTTLQGLDK